MAIMTNYGKLSGKVGNLVYKVVNGRTVVSSLPRRKKGWFKPEERHERFKLATRMSSRIYRELKEFYLNLPPGDLFNRLTSLLVNNHEEVMAGDGTAGWREIPSQKHFWFPKWVHPYDIVFAQPAMDFDKDGPFIEVPARSSYEGAKRSYRIPHGVSSFEDAVTIIHYDFETESAQVVYEWKSERYGYGGAYEGKTILRPVLVDVEGNPIEDGLLVAALNIRSFATRTSTAYLNSKKFNPLNILGVWVKG